VLLWKWKKKAYLGAVHGIIGILYPMLKAVEIVGTGHFKDHIREALRNTVDFLLKVQLPSGNIPSYVGAK